MTECQTLAAFAVGRSRSRALSSRPSALNGPQGDDKRSGTGLRDSPESYIRDEQLVATGMNSLILFYALP